MCGIGGMLANTYTGRLDPKICFEFMDLLENQGHGAAGVVIVSPTLDYTVIKRAESWSKWPKEYRDRTWQALHSATAFLCHTRAPSVGENNLTNVHPFQSQSPDIFLAHNGGIGNYQTIFNKHKYAGPITCDSYALLLEFREHLKAGKSMEELLTLMKSLDPFNAWALVPRKREVYIMTNYGGLYGMKQGDVFYFANTQLVGKQKRLPPLIKADIDWNRLSDFGLKANWNTPKVEDLILASDDKYFYIHIPEAVVEYLKYSGYNSWSPEGWLKMARARFDDKKEALEQKIKEGLEGE